MFGSGGGGIGIQIALVALSCVITALLTLVVISIRSIKQDFRREQDVQDEKIEAVGKDLARLEANLPKEFVMRDDYIRTITVFDHKLDTLTEKVEDLKEVILNRDKEEA